MIDFAKKLYAIRGGKKSVKSVRPMKQLALRQWVCGVGAHKFSEVNTKAAIDTLKHRLGKAVINEVLERSGRAVVVVFLTEDDMRDGLNTPYHEYLLTAEVSDLEEESKMYHDEEVVDGVLCWKSTPDGEWTPFTTVQLTKKLLECRVQVESQLAGWLKADVALREIGTAVDKAIASYQ